MNSLNFAKYVECKAGQRHFFNNLRRLVVIFTETDRKRPYI